MRVKIDLMIGLFLILFAFTSQLDIYLVLMIFALIHELGHLCAGIILGYRPKEIKINPLGFKMELEEKDESNIGTKEASIKRAIIAIAGPMTNLIIIFIIIFLTNTILGIQDFKMWNITTQDIIYANMLIGIFNLIPIYPLDGGRALKEILYLTIGFKKSYKSTYLISKTTIIFLTVLASIGVLFIHNISIALIVAYLWIIMIAESRKKASVICDKE